MKTRVVHVNDRIEGAVYIGRRNRRRGFATSPFENPFPLGYPATPERRSEVIASFRRHLLRSPHLLARLPELRGKPLACWCRYDGTPRNAKNACHGDVLVELLERYSDDELHAMGDAS